MHQFRCVWNAGRGKPSHHAIVDAGSEEEAKRVLHQYLTAHLRVLTFTIYSAVDLGEIITPAVISCEGIREENSMALHERIMAVKEKQS